MDRYRVGGVVSHPVPYASDAPISRPLDAGTMSSCPASSNCSSSPRPAAVVGAASPSRRAAACVARSPAASHLTWRARCWRRRWPGGGAGAELHGDAADLRGAGSAGHAPGHRHPGVRGRARTRPRALHRRLLHLPQSRPEEAEGADLGTRRLLDLHEASDHRHLRDRRVMECIHRRLGGGDAGSRACAA